MKKILEKFLALVKVVEGKREKILSIQKEIEEEVRELAATQDTLKYDLVLIAGTSGGSTQACIKSLKPGIKVKCIPEGDFRVQFDIACNKKSVVKVYTKCCECNRDAYFEMEKIMVDAASPEIIVWHELCHDHIQIKVGQTIIKGSTRS